jgi:hypothetical protein
VVIHRQWKRHPNTVDRQTTLVPCLVSPTIALIWTGRRDFRWPGMLFRQQPPPTFYCVPRCHTPSTAPGVDLDHPSPSVPTSFPFRATGASSARASWPVQAYEVPFMPSHQQFLCHRVTLTLQPRVSPVCPTAAACVRRLETG